MARARSKIEDGGEVSLYVLRCVSAKSDERFIERTC